MTLKLLVVIEDFVALSLGVVVVLVMVVVFIACSRVFLLFVFLDFDLMDCTNF